MNACSFAPKYETPVMPVPKQYQETGKWVKAKPNLALTTQKAPWWTLYQDPTLNALEHKATCGNEDLKLALNRYQEACAILQSTRSELYPTILGISSVTRQQNSASVANSNDLPILLYNTYLVGGTLNYEVDAWGRVRNAVAASSARARASQLDVVAIGLSAHALLAINYFQLRGADEALGVLEQTIGAYQHALRLTKSLHQGGAVSVVDVDEVITQLENAKTLATDTRLKRAQLEHSIAVLAGEIPSNFHIVPRKSPMRSVTVAPNLPSELLERRPDIASAQARVMAANASIGVARAAFFPQINLSGMMGFQSRDLSQLFSSPSFVWSMGPPTSLFIATPLVSQVIFDGFSLQAQLKRANAQYHETVSAYRQTVLTAFQEVEDSLVAIRRLDEERHTQAISTAAAKRAWTQALSRYKGGIATYLNVVVPENQALQSELALIHIKTRRQVASVQLIKALGGGWPVVKTH